MPNASLCAKCIAVATHTVELVVSGQRMEQALCDIHMGELLDGTRLTEAT
jgi:hypothetical protein